MNATIVLSENERKALRWQARKEKAKVYGKAGLTIALMTSPVLAMSATQDLKGGLTKFQGDVVVYRDLFFGLLGVIATIYLLWKALDAWQGRADWKEFALSVLYVAIAGGSIQLARWAWGYFSGETPQ